MAPRKTYECGRCLRSFTSRALLLEHKFSQHGQVEEGRAQYDTVGVDICPHCGGRFAGFDGVGKHTRQDKRCSRLQDVWEKGLASAAPSVVHSDSSSSDSDAFDTPRVAFPTDSNEESAHTPSSPRMEVDAPDEQRDTSDVQESLDETDDPTLVEWVNTCGNTVYVESHPKQHAGQPIRRATPDDLPESYQEYPEVGKLSNPESFEIARLLMESGVSGHFQNRYLTLKRIKDRMPWSNNRVLLIDIDKLPHGPPWKVKTWTLHGNRGSEVVEFWRRDSLGAIKHLLLDRALGRHMRWRLVRHYTSRSKKERWRDELWTADWMWDVLTRINDDYATLISCIVSSDETRLTNFQGNKKAHPVYLTIGNLPKRLRKRISKRSSILIGYLPVPKLDCETRVEEKRKIKQEIFHRCMEELLAPLADAVNAGGAEVPCADGNIRRIYPVLASYVADHPEQCKVACVKQTHCPLCTVHPKSKGDLTDSSLRTTDDVIQTMKRRGSKGARRFKRQGLLPIRPFWESMLFVDIGTLMTPDLLHQLHKGVMKDHLIRWVTTILGKPLVDERYTSMPDYQGLRHFKNGISSVSQWTGRELKEMTKVLLPAISHANPRVVRAARSLLDFVYLSHLSSMTSEDLGALEDALQTFHNHKDVFAELGAVTTDAGFHGIPKLHMISHYAHLIRQLGTPDGYNTETSERLHIDFAKLGYRASNKVNATKQMALYMQRTEAIAMHAAHLKSIGVSVPRTAAQTLDQVWLDIDRGDDWEPEDEWDEWDEENEEDEWDEWDAIQREEEEEDSRELEQAGVIVEANSEMFSRAWEVRTAHYLGPDGEPQGQSDQYYPNPNHVVAKTPTLHVTAKELVDDYGATRLFPAIDVFLKSLDRSHQSLPAYDDQLFNIWTRARLFHSAAPFNMADGSWIDVIRAHPSRRDVFERVTRRARFDVVFISGISTREDKVGVQRYRAGRVRAIFELPGYVKHRYSEPLVYVDLYENWSPHPVAPTGLFTVKRKFTARGLRACAVIPLSDIPLTCHLAPKYDTLALDHWLEADSDVLEIFPTFFLNIFASHPLYNLLRHWEQAGLVRYEQAEEDPPADDDDQDSDMYEPEPEPASDGSEEREDDEDDEPGDMMDMDDPSPSESDRERPVRAVSHGHVIRIRRPGHGVRALGRGRGFQPSEVIPPASRGRGDRTLRRRGARRG
ncbi:hypothetical protein RhiJN_20750 [Ceratobasidium sp. AG-Ba]|nr:hypothetical protein RhiJN_20750 [Ceratobasidium sp. AG-Ba]